VNLCYAQTVAPNSPLCFPKILDAPLLGIYLESKIKISIIMLLTYYGTAVKLVVGDNLWAT